MAGFRISAIASARLDEIFAYSRDAWGEARADAYIRGLFDCFISIARGKAPARPVPAEFGIDGHYCRYQRHYVYWRRLSDNHIGIVTILHERMHQTDRFRDDIES